MARASLSAHRAHPPMAAVSGPLFALIITVMVLIGVCGIICFLCMRGHCDKDRAGKYGNQRDKPAGRGRQGGPSAAAHRRNTVHERKMEEGVRSMSGAPPTDLSNLPVAPGWEEAWDTTSNKHYYFNTLSQETSWTKPVVDSARASMARPSGAGRAARAGTDWQEAQDPDTGKTYYFDPDSGATTWDRPRCITAGRSALDVLRGNPMHT